ncbi:MAG TPA: hypothetical protein VIT22_12315 [Pseudoxanthomonas sp.]
MGRALPLQPVPARAERRSNLGGDGGGNCVIGNAKQQLRWYESTPGAERSFCRHCGSMLFFRSGRWPGELHIALAHFTTPVDRIPRAPA